MNHPATMYKIPEWRLLQLLESEDRLDCLEQDGVDNWDWYMEGKGQYLLEGADAYDALATLEEDECFDFGDLAMLRLNDFERIED